MGDAPHVGLVGCGHWGRYILRDLRELGCEVTVVARSEASVGRAREGKAKAVVGSVEDLPAVDGVVVATGTPTHAEVVDRLLDRGTAPIFVEKPLTSDAASASRIADRAPDTVFVMDKWRYHPGVEALRDVARTEELGPVIGLRTIRLGWGNPHADSDAVWILAPHDLAIVLEILGWIPEPKIAVGDPGPSGGAGLGAVLGVEPWVMIEVSARSPVRRREVILYCGEGTATLPDGYADHVLVARDRDGSTPPERRTISEEWPLLRELRAFVEHLGGGPPPKSDATEAARMVETLALLRQMARLEPPGRMLSSELRP